MSEKLMSKLPSKSVTKSREFPPPKIGTASRNIPASGNRIKKHSPQTLSAQRNSMSNLKRKEFRGHRFVEHLRSQHDQSVTVVFEMKAADGSVQLSLPANVVGDPRKLRHEVFGKGIAVTEHVIDWMHQFAAVGEKTITVTARGQWSKQHRQFVNCYGTFGIGSGVASIRFDPKSPFFLNSEKAGNHQDYLEYAGRVMRFSSLLTITYVQQLLCPLALRLGFTGSIVISVVGRSSLGKSTAQYFAKSLVTKPDRRSLQTSNVSDVRVVNQLAPFAGTTICVGDLKAFSGRAQDLAQMLRLIIFSSAENSQRKTMLTVREDGGAPEFVGLLLVAEKTILQLLERGGVNIEDGERVRVFELPIKAPLGIFDLARSAEASRKAIAYLERNLTKSYGHVYPAWCKCIAEYSGEHLRTHFDSLKAQFISTRRRNEARHDRILDQVGMMYATGMLAIKCDLLPIDEGHLIVCMDWLLATGARGLDDAEQVHTNQWRSLLNGLTSKRDFPKLRLGIEPATGIDASNGFRRHEDGESRLYVRNDHLVALRSQAQISKNQWQSIFAPDLLKADVLIEEKTVTIQQAGLGEKRRYWHFSIPRLLAFKQKMVGS